MRPNKQLKRDKQLAADKCAKKTGWKNYRLNGLEIEAVIMRIRKAQSRFVQRFGKLRIHAVAYGQGVAYCAYDKALQRIVLFIPFKVGLYMDQHRGKTKRQARIDREKMAVSNSIRYVGAEIQEFVHTHDMSAEGNKAKLLTMRNAYAALCDKLTDMIGATAPAETLSV